MNIKLGSWKDYKINGYQNSMIDSKLYPKQIETAVIENDRLYLFWVKFLFLKL
jgi:hypothetical protein